jgi:hypothetical protein
MQKHAMFHVSVQERINKPIEKNMTFQIIFEYMRSSNVHGVRYVQEDKRSSIER